MCQATPAGLEDLLDAPDGGGAPRRPEHQADAGGDVPAPVREQAALLPQAPWLAAQLYKLILLATSLGRLLVSPLAWLERSPRREQHLALAGHYRRLARALPGM